MKKTSLFLLMLAACGGVEDPSLAVEQDEITFTNWCIETEADATLVLDDWGNYKADSGDVSYATTPPCPRYLVDVRYPSHVDEYAFSS